MLLAGLRRSLRFACPILVVCGLAFWFAPWPTPAARAQAKAPAEGVVEEAQLSQVLRVGEQFESERKWGDALTHYEHALKEHPGRRDIQQRLTLARIHYDVERRFTDHSYTAGLADLSERSALDLYSEVLLKIHAHYVVAPNWGDLVRRGTAHLDVALLEPIFVDKSLPGVSADRIESFRRDMHRELDAKSPQNRQEARDLVALAARKAAGQLGVGMSAVVMEYACGATGALDEYSGYLTGDQLDEVFSQIEGNFVGLGVELKAENQALSIVSVIPGGPADKGGIRPGDRIVEVDGRPTRDVSTDAACDLLKGEEGSAVSLRLIAPSGEERILTVRRQRVDVPSVDEIKIVDRELGIGYLKLTSFQKTTSADLDAALWKLHRDGMKSLIIDVRGNPGGLLTASVEAADKFLSSGTIVSTRGRSPREDFDYKAHAPGTWRVPLVVLIDGDSASASEIFAGAIHDHRRGTVVGQRSYGKGSVQGIFPLNVTKAGVRLTTAKFYSPSGQPIAQRGVFPDLEVRTAAKPVATPVKIGGEADDPTLKAGLQVARQQLSQR
jgi:carboxyl-terminal processing protease